MGASIQLQVGGVAYFVAAVRLRPCLNRTEVQLIVLATLPLPPVTGSRALCAITSLPYPGPARLRRKRSSPGRDQQWVLELEIGIDSLDPEGLLAEADGFLVDGRDGREVGVVEGVVRDAESGAAVTLMITAGLFGRRLLRADAQAVDVLIPAEQRLVVDPAGLEPAGHDEPAA
jgi:hypothetical protein